MDDFNRILREATQAIEAPYFRLPVAEGDDIYRERVYCYELYHQMRLKWCTESPYKLCGEIDKVGHDLFKRAGVWPVKPDLLVHVPRTMDNYAAIEVKTCNAKNEGVEKDVKTLKSLVEKAEYERAIFLVFGNENLTRITNDFGTAVTEHNARFIEFWHHKEAERPAEKLNPGCLGSMLP